MRRQRNGYGSALISAILITAIVVMLATALAVSERLLIHAAQTTVQSDQMVLALQGEQIFAAQKIKKYTAQWLHPNNQFFPLQNTLSEIEMNRITLTSRIEDEQGKYNLNNLVYAANQNQFVVLLQVVIPTISKQAAWNIAKSITDWETTGSQDPYYLSLHPAYRTSKQEMVNITEFRLIAGVTSTIFSAIAPVVTALPLVHSASSSGALSTPIDINNASAPVLLAVNPHLTLAQAQQLIDCRQEHRGFFKVSDFIKTCAKPQGIADVSHLTTQSQYFQIILKAIRNQHVVFLRSLVAVQIGQNHQVKISTIWQS